MSLHRLLAQASRRPVRGRPLSRARAHRDPGKVASLRKFKPLAHEARSDVIWGLAERMLAGDGDAAIALSEIIGNGVTAGSTRFERITRAAWKRQGHSEPAKVQPGAFAAVTPGRSIILFGMKKEYKTGDPPGGVMRGYLRRFKVGDTAEYNSYNLVYLGKITSITAKRVVVQHYPQAGSKKSSFDIETFNSKNYDLDVDKAIKRNQSWSD